MTTRPGIYAKDTEVDPESTLREIRDTLKRYGATSFGLIDNETQINIAFEMNRRRVRFSVPLPRLNEIRKTNGDRMSKEQTQQAYEKRIRQRWRALLLVIKAKLESVESGIETFEDAFMAQLIIADGRTMSEWAKPQLAQLYSGDKLPPLLGSGN